MASIADVVATPELAVLAMQGAVTPNEREPTPGSLLLGMQGEEVEATYYGIEDGYGIDSDKLWTASGERFDPAGFTAATNLYPLGTKLLVTYAGFTVVVRVNDRCGLCSLDLSRAAFERLAPLSRGRITVTVKEER